MPSPQGSKGDAVRPLIMEVAPCSPVEVDLPALDADGDQSLTLVVCFPCTLWARPHPDSSFGRRWQLPRVLSGPEGGAVRVAGLDAKDPDEVGLSTPIQKFANVSENRSLRR